MALEIVDHTAETKRDEVVRFLKEIKRPIARQSIRRDTAKAVVSISRYGSLFR